MNKYNLIGYFWENHLINDSSFRNDCLWPEAQWHKPPIQQEVNLSHYDKLEYPSFEVSTFMQSMWTDEMPTYFADAMFPAEFIFELMLLQPLRSGFYWASVSHNLQNMTSHHNTRDRDDNWIENGCLKCHKFLS